MDEITGRLTQHTAMGGFVDGWRFEVFQPGQETRTFFVPIAAIRDVGLVFAAQGSLPTGLRFDARDLRRISETEVAVDRIEVTSG